MENVVKGIDYLAKTWRLCHKNRRTHFVKYEIKMQTEECVICGMTRKFKITYLARCSSYAHAIQTTDQKDRMFSHLCSPTLLSERLSSIHLKAYFAFYGCFYELNSGRTCTCVCNADVDKIIYIYIYYKLFSVVFDDPWAIYSFV